MYVPLKFTLTFPSYSQNNDFLSLSYIEMTNTRDRKAYEIESIYKNGRILSNK